MTTIDRATKSDLHGIADLLHTLFSQDIEFVPNREKQIVGLTMIIENRSVGEIFTMRENGTIIGMVSLLYSISTALGGKVALLEDMIIDPDFRGIGLGTKLLNYAIDYAKESGVLRVTLLTDFDNESAIRYYERNGFVKSSMIPLRMVFAKEKR